MGISAFVLTLIVYPDFDIFLPIKLFFDSCGLQCDGNKSKLDCTFMSAWPQSKFSRVSKYKTLLGRRICLEFEGRTSNKCLEVISQPREDLMSLKLSGTVTAGFAMGCGVRLRSTEKQTSPSDCFP